ncbi:MAG: NAD-dependent epimerase/dehydratase family protein [Alphaproteobacteria bacterium]|nr:NAD-dependent epimerase/dehydratase family protein [Alphaproteobacteria bacterium]
MKVVITGGTGMLGRRLALRLLAAPDDQSELVGPSGRTEALDHLILVDAFEPAEPPPEDPRVTVVSANICDSAVARQVIDDSVDSVFHFAAVVSGGAEADFDLGYQVNLDGARNVFEACRASTGIPRVVFTSSLAVYGGFRDIVDDTPLTPQTSYGAQKAIGELMVNDYSRKGFFDGRSLRLPTIVVRPGKPNKAASGFASSILREPLQGEGVSCPVSAETRMLILSPRRAVQAFIDVHNSDAEQLGFRRGVMMNGISPSIGEMASALREIAGDKVADRISWEPDAQIQWMVDSWPWFADGVRGRELGFQPDGSIEEVIQNFIDDELDGQIAN